MRDEANPVGSAVEDQLINDFLEVRLMEWEAEKEKSPWWKFWGRISFVRVTDFLLDTLDELIAYVDEVIEHGPDKKATVLDAVGKLYDFIAREAMPIWLKPFTPQIKEIIINGMLSPAIDWIVAKYRNGNWRKPEKSELLAGWQVRAQSHGVPFGGTLPK